MISVQIFLVFRPHDKLSSLVLSLKIQSPYYAYYTSTITISKTIACNLNIEKAVWGTREA